MDKALAELEAGLTQLIAEHRQLLEQLRGKQQAMRRAKPAEVEARCTQEQAIVYRIGRLETQRQETVRRITQAIDPAAKSPMSITQIAPHIEEPMRGRLLVLRGQLRELIETVRRENDIARVATEGLLKHVQGIVQQVVAAMGAGTYGRRGAMHQTPTLASTFSVTG
jgi:hypothetical protein